MGYRKEVDGRRREGARCPEYLLSLRLRSSFARFLHADGVLFFSAPCGCGKTALAEELLKGKAVYRLFAGEADFAFPQEEGWDILLIEDFQRLQEDAEQKALCEWIRNYPEKRFVLLSRGTPPGYLMAFQYAGLMQVAGYLCAFV